MRSGAVAWLLDLYGFKVYALAGGYKAFRNWVLQQFEVDYNFMILGGYTGSGKTYLLHELQKQGEHIIDLEQLANHKGSSFGNIGLPAQPSQEMFENMLAVRLVDGCQMTNDSDEDSMLKTGKLQTTNHKLINPSSQRIWLEDESQRIGKVNIPVALWNTIRQKPVCFLDIDFEERLNHIVQEYGNCEKEKLVDAILRIQKRLGGLEMKTALNFLTEGDVKESFRILLKYYDKQYLKALNKRDASAPLITKFESKKVGVENASALLHAIKHLA
jgi:tRNA 2-selenouridine synthase